MKGDPTQITRVMSTEEKLNLLKQHFKEFAQGTVIEGTATEVLEVKEDEPNC